MKPTRKQHLIELVFNRPFDLLLSVACILTGSRIIIDWNAAPPTIADMPEPMAHIYRVLLVVAGVLYLIGLIKREVSSFEIAGLWLSMTVLLVYGTSAVASGMGPGASFAVILVFCMGIASAIRAVGAARVSKARLVALKEITRGRDE